MIIGVPVCVVIKGGNRKIILLTGLKDYIISIACVQFFTVQSIHFSFSLFQAE